VTKRDRAVGFAVAMCGALLLAGCASSSGTKGGATPGTTARPAHSSVRGGSKVAQSATASQLAAPDGTNGSGNSSQACSSLLCDRVIAPSTTADIHGWAEGFLGQGWARATGAESGSFGVPRFWNSSYSEATHEVDFSGTNSNGSSMGFGIELNNAGAALFEGFFVTVPYSPPQGGGGSITYTFTTVAAARFLGAPVGSNWQSPTQDHRYLVTLQHPNSAEWEMSIRPNPGGPGPQPELTSGSLSLSTSSVRPPWSEVQMQLTARSPYGLVQGSVKLSRHSGPFTYTTKTSSSASP